MMIMRVAVASAGAVAAMYVVENFVLRESDDSPKGFITKKPGFGVDDVVMGLGVGLGVLLALKVSGHA